MREFVYYYKPKGWNGYTTIGDVISVPYDEKELLKLAEKYPAVKEAIDEYRRERKK